MPRYVHQLAVDQTIDGQWCDISGNARDLIPYGPCDTMVMLRDAADMRWSFPGTNAATGHRGHDDPTGRESSQKRLSELQSG